MKFREDTIGGIVVLIFLLILSDGIKFMDFLVSTIPPAFIIMAIIIGVTTLFIIDYIIAKNKEQSATLKKIKHEKWIAEIITQMKSNNDFALIVNFLNKYNILEDSSERHMLLQVLVNKNYPIDEKDLMRILRISRKEIQKSKLRELILSEKPKTLQDFIIAFIHYEGWELGFTIENFMEILDQNKLVGELDKKDILQKIDVTRNALQLQNFEANLINDENELLDIDQMTGIEFENFLAHLFQKMKFRVEETPQTGDQGADLILSRKNEKAVVQVKRYSNKVNNKAIQEVVAAKRFYDANKCMVVTSNYFTRSAMELAKKNKVILIDRSKLENLIEKYL